MEKNKRHFFVVVDYNDADYVKDIITVTEEQYNKFKPLIEAIENYEPYVCRHEYSGVDYNNWKSYRPDLGEKTVYEKYPQFDPELIDEFDEVFLNIPNPESECCDGFHTIVKIQEVTFGDVILDSEANPPSKRRSAKIDAYFAEMKQIESYCRKSDGKSLSSIPFSEMTPEENALIEQLHNLWKKYQ